jgi:hypothetical protein
MAIEIVDLPIQNCDFPVRYVSLPAGTEHLCSIFCFAVPILLLSRRLQLATPSRDDQRPGGAHVIFCFGMLKASATTCRKRKEQKSFTICGFWIAFESEFRLVLGKVP